MGAGRAKVWVQGVKGPGSGESSSRASPINRVPGRGEGIPLGGGDGNPEPGPIYMHIHIYIYVYMYVHFHIHMHIFGASYVVSTTQHISQLQVLVGPPARSGRRPG